MFRTLVKDQNCWQALSPNNNNWRGPVSYNITLPDGRCLRRHVNHIRSRQCEPVDNVPVLPVEKPPVDVFKPLVPPKVPPDESNMAPAEVPPDECSISVPHRQALYQADQTTTATGSVVVCEYKGQNNPHGH